MPSDNPAERLQRYFQGDTEAVEPLLLDSNYYQKIERLAQKNTRGTNLSWEDAAQEARIKVLQAARNRKFRQGGVREFYKWAATVAFNAIIDLVRKDKRWRGDWYWRSLDECIPGTDLPLGEVVADEFNLLESVEIADLVAKARDAVETLSGTFPKKKYGELWRGLVAGKTQTQLAAELGVKQAEISKRRRELLAKVGNILAEPKREEVNVHLWDEGGWDILFFAGHSSSEGERGCLYINSKDKLTIAELKYALRRAVERGLKLAIFNSCDGLALAKELADLHIPQIIVMREPVMDRVAGEFLGHFIQAYAGGKSLSGAVREARERLQGLEEKFPCASWLPVICQHPAEVPPTWQRLRGIVAGEDNQELLELVAKLREAVEADLDLPAEDKADVLEQVQFLGRAANSPLEVLSQRQARKALIFIRGAIASLPPTAKLVEVAEELLGAIGRLFDL